jgi:dihydropteroate synthase
MFDLTTLFGDPLVSGEWPPEPFFIGETRFDFAKQRFVVGVVNLSADSQYPESIASTPGQAIRKARSLVAVGADVIEFGTESTRYGAIRRGTGEQLQLLEPVLEGCSALGVPIAVEAASADLFERVAKGGVRIFNLKGYQDFDRIISVAHDYSAAVVLPYLTGRDAHQHTKLDPGSAKLSINLFLEDRLIRLREAGVVEVIVDPGLGFYFPVTGGAQARLSYQLTMYLRLYELRIHRAPILVTLVQASSIFDAGYRRLAEPVLSVLALLGGANFIRTHEVAAVDRVRRLLDVTSAV